MRAARFAVVVMLAAACSACVGDKAYRTDKNPSVLSEKLRVKDFDPSQVGVLNREFPYRLLFIEFNDQGQMFDRAQLTRAIEEITAAKKRGKILVAAFVHGWKNNASDKSGNVWGWRQVLAGLSANDTDPEVIGLYIGWRGRSLDPPILKEFSFADRRAKSQSVGTKEMVGALREIMQTIKGPDYDDDSAISILVGHSFGGAVLESAATPELRRAMATARERKRPVQWPADLIMLLNEAQEAEASYPLIEEMHATMQPRRSCVAPPRPGEGLREDGPRYQRPAVISISSTGDYATRGFFPGAQLITRPFSRSYDGKDPFDVGGSALHFGTTAHTGKLRSHLIARADDPEIVKLLALCQPIISTDLSMMAVNAQYVMVEQPETANTTPYWVTHMPPSIVPDHSTIFTQIFRDFLVTLIGNAVLQPPQNELLETR